MQEECTLLVDRGRRRTLVRCRVLSIKILSQNSYESVNCFRSHRVLLVHAVVVGYIAVSRRTADLIETVGTLQYPASSFDQKEEETLRISCVVAWIYVVLTLAEAWQLAN